MRISSKKFTSSILLLSLFSQYAISQVVDGLNPLRRPVGACRRLGDH
jgi:hypothetical protein